MDARSARRRQSVRRAVEKGPDARRRPKAAGEAYFEYVEPAAEGANEADGPLSAARPCSPHGPSERRLRRAAPEVTSVSRFLLELPLIQQHAAAQQRHPRPAMRA